MTTATRLRSLYIVSDYLLSLTAICAFSVVRYFYIPVGTEPRSLPEWLFHDVPVIIGIVLYPLIFVIVAAISGYYNHVVAKSRLEDIKNAVGCAFTVTLTIFFIALINDYIPDRLSNYRLLMILWTLLAAFTTSGRLLINHSRRTTLRASGGIYRAVVVGMPESAARITQRLSANRQASVPLFNVVGYVDPRTSTQEIISKVRTSEAEDIIITGHPDGLEATTQLINSLYLSECSLHLSVDLYNLITSRNHCVNVTSEPLINITTANVAPSTMNLKRLSDIAISAFALVALSPLLAAISLAVRGLSGGSVLYLQERVGYHKKKFNIIKFRTMIPDAESMGPALSSESDPRITPVGRFLRKYRLDELPQFWNVLKGDMSLVGPRPEREFYIRQIVTRVPQYSLIHQVRPGITSWGMVKYGYARNVDQMVERLVYDLMYLENVSMALDIKILFHTVRTVFTGRGL